MSDEERTPQEIIERLRLHQEDGDVAYYVGDMLDESADAIEDLIKERNDAETAAGILASENRRLRDERSSCKDLIDYIQELLLRISSLEGIIDDLRKEVSSMRERESNRTYS